MKRKSYLLLTGRFIELISKDICWIKRSLNEQLLQHQSVLCSSRAFLAQERFYLAELLLKEGLELVPSENEEAGLAAEAVSCSADELILGVGDNISEHLLKRLAGHVSITLLTCGSVNSSVVSLIDDQIDLSDKTIIQSTDKNIQSTISDSPSLDCENLNSENPDADNTNELDQPESACHSKVTDNAEVTDNAKIADDAKAIDNANDHGQSESASHAKVADDAEKEPLAESNCLEEQEEESDQWKEDLCHLVKGNGDLFLADTVFAILGRTYPKLYERYTKDPHSLQNEIPDSLRWITEKDQVMIYSKEHPQLQPIPAVEAAAKLTFSAGSKSGYEEMDNNWSMDKTDKSAEDFLEISIRAEILRQAALLLRERELLLSEEIALPDDYYQRNQELEQKAHEHYVYFWFKRQKFSIDQLQIVADCYNTLQKAAVLTHNVLEAKLRKAFIEQILQVMADAVCLVKTMILDHKLNLNTDHVLQNAFDLTITASQNTYINNLHKEDRYPFSQRDQIEKQINTLNEKFQSQTSLEKLQLHSKKKIMYHLDKISKNLPGTMNDWNKVVEGVTTLCDKCRIPATSSVYRTLLGEYIQWIPEEAEITSSFGDIVQQLELDEENREEEVFDLKFVPKYTPAVKQVRKTYEGSKVVFIGGIPVEHLKQRIENRFNVKIIWDTSDHGDSFERFTSVLNDPEVRLFLVYIPWCSHKHSEELSRLVHEAGKDFVRLRKGTNPDRIASAICQQTGSSFEPKKTKARLVKK